MTHFRHGARAPQKFYDKTKYLDYLLEHWENPGELTGMGQRMHYLLGIRNRLRYIEEENFLSETFNPHEILIYSTCINRTIISASSQLQGLYPQYINKGESITETQIEKSIPQVNIDNDIIKNEIKNLNNYSLPYSMILAPIRMINNNEKKMRLYDIDKCKEKTVEIKKNNGLTLDTLINVIKEFKEKYEEKLKKFYGKEENYDLGFLDNFCDAFISGYTEGKELEKLKEVGIYPDDLNDFCDKFQVLNFRDWILGDKNHSVAHLESSKLMAEFIHYMKERVDADINNENIDLKYDDYSRPKMLMISGHDTTISCFEIFLMEAFGKDLNFYRYPKFASQIAFEVVRKDENKNGKNYNDYTINYYFDDDLFLTISMQEFIDKVTPQIWDDKKINEFCGYDNGKNSDKDKGGNKKDEKDDDLKNICLIIFISLTIIFLASTILLFIKLV